MGDTLLKTRKISKSFPGVQALDAVDFELQAGEIRGLVGENGAGKSTLIKVFAGVYSKDAGTLIYRGEEVDITDPAEAKELGLAFIHQDLNLVPQFDAVDNIWLGSDYPRRRGKLDRSRMEEEVLELSNELDFELDLHRPVRRLSTADKWLVAILKAFMEEARVLVLDEPAAALTDEEVESLFSNLERLRSRGLGIIYVSHRLEEVLDIADSITVLKDGKKVADKQSDEVRRDDVIRLMVGREGPTELSDRQRSVGPGDGEVLRVSDASGPGFEEVSFSLLENEVLGFFGLVGAGRTELMETIFGLRDLSTGRIILDETELTEKTPKRAIEEGLVLVPEDRREEGLVLNTGVDENITLPNLELILRSPILRNIDKEAEREETRRIVERLDVKTPSLDQPVRFLSGGNQQKVVVGKWLLRDASVIIFDEPTTGIDVGTKGEIYSLVNELAEDASLLVVSSDLRELTGISDRIIVMSNGKVTGRLDRSEFSQEKIMQLAYEEVE